MTLARAFLFVPWFAWFDLLGSGRARRITLVNLVSVLALVAFALLVYGMVLGTERRQMEQFRTDPLAACLVLRPISKGKPLTKADVADLEKEVVAKLGSPDRLRAIAPFHDFAADWFRPGSDVSPALQGRTVADNDPLFASYQGKEHWLSGGPTNTRTEAVLGPNALKELGVKSGPPKLDVRWGLSKQAVPVAGALNKDLPGRYDVFLPESLYLELFRTGYDPRTGEVFTGPLAPRWAALANPQPEIDDYLLAKGIDWVGPDVHDKSKVWRFSHPGPDFPALTTWQIHLENIGRRLKKAHGEAAVGFTVPAPVGEVPPPPAPTGYQRIALYLTDLDGIASALEAIQAKEYEVVDDRHQQILRIQRTTARALALSTVVMLAVAGLVFWNLCAIQGLQAEQKRPEVGMLKALGMTGRRLLMIYSLEAFLLWLSGALFGCGVGWVLGHWAEQWLGRDVPQATLAFIVPPFWLAVILGGSFLVCLGSTLLATWWPLRRSPVECLTEA